MNAVAQGGDQCVDEVDMMGQHARTHGSTCAPLEGCRAAFNLKKKPQNEPKQHKRSDASYSPSGIFPRGINEVESLMYSLSLWSFIHLIV